MKNFLKNKWHLHAICGALFAILLMLLFNLDDNLCWFDKVFLSLTFTFILGIFFELMQERLYKSNQLMKVIIGDALATTVGGIIGIILYLIF